MALSMFLRKTFVTEMFKSGAAGYLLKDTPREELVKAVRGTVSGRTYVDPGVAGKVIDHMAAHRTQPASLITEKLTEREIEVLRLIGKGLSNADIAGSLFLSEGTVRNHVSAILSKLGVSDRTQAAVIAIHHGLNGS